jgi:dTDP-4-amino-4,6-dideoxygalactose transaminase
MIHYPIPPHKQRCFAQWNNLSFPITERIHNEELSLPISQAMTLDEVDQVTAILTKAVEGSNKSLFDTLIK